MTNHEMVDQNANATAYQRRLRWGLAVLLAIALFFLWQEHRAHLLGALPWLLLLACPLMHRFMHGGHRSHGDAEPRPTGENQEPAQKDREHEHGGHGCC